MSKQIKDLAAREAIATELDICMLVEAGAGSGKTSSLVRRMLELVRTGTCPVEHIAAVTFTRKAAAELKERFQEDMEKALGNTPDPEKNRRLQQALLDINRCFIGTIHSFCASLLRERPVEARIDPGFKEIEELEDRILRDRSWQQYVIRLQSEPQNLEGLEKIDITLQDLRAMFDILCTFPDVDFARQKKCPQPDLDPARGELIKILHMAENLLPSQEPDGGWDNLQQRLQTARRWQELYGFSRDLIFLRLLAQMNRSATIVQKRWPDKNQAKELREAFVSFQKNMVMPTLEKWWNHRYDSCLGVLLDGANYYAEERRTAGVLNFQDLLMHTAGLLKDNHEVRTYFQQRYRCILIDEFQDTDPIQAEIMFYLAGENCHETDWRLITPRPGSLFVVGDPKQSIYRFRRAEIGIYYEVKQRFEATGGRILYLTTNFRSLRAIGDWANPVFSQHFPSEGDTFQAGYKELDMVREAEPKREGGVRALAIAPDSRQKDVIAAEDARMVAAWIARALQQKLELSRTDEETEAEVSPLGRPGNFMVLLRYRDNMDLYASALQEKGIPYTITGGRGLSTSRELRELLLILLALQDPSDPVRLIAALRGLFFGISDDDLYRLKRAGGTFNFLSSLPGAMEPEPRARLRQAFDCLCLYRKWTRTLPPRTGVEQIMEHAGMIPASLWQQTHQGPAAFPVQFLELAGKKELPSWTALIEYLESLLETGVEEEISLEGGGGNAVRLMNLHKAKGLEAPVVFLANPGKKVEGSVQFHIDRKGSIPRGYIQLTRPQGFQREVLARPQGWTDYEETEKAYNDAEEMRLLYVAATRAKNLLLISTLPQKEEMSPWNPIAGGLPPCVSLENLDPDRIPGMKLLDKTDLDPQELLQARKHFPSAGRPEHSPTYFREAVTALKGLGPEPLRVTTGRGVSWGNVIHRLLEIYGEQKPPDPYLTVTRILDEENRSPDEAREVLDLLQQMEDTPFWKRLKASPRRMREVPVSGQLRDPENRDRMQTVSGIIDLVFAEDGGWVIVDYKSDHIENETHRDQLVRYYSPQIQIYRHFWQHLSGEPVRESGLFFVSTLEWVPVEEE